MFQTIAAAQVAASDFFATERRASAVTFVVAGVERRFERDERAGGLKVRVA